MTTTARVTGPAATTTSGRLPLLVAGQSLLYGVLGVLWLFGADWYPFGPVPPAGDKLSLLSFVPDQVPDGTARGARVPRRTGGCGASPD